MFSLSSHECEEERAFPCSQNAFGGGRKDWPAGHIFLNYKRNWPADGFYTDAQTLQILFRNFLVNHIKKSSLSTQKIKGNVFLEPKFKYYCNYKTLPWKYHLFSH